MNQEHVERYTAVALQLPCHAVNLLPDRKSARQRMAKTIAAIGQRIAATRAFIGSQARLFVLPEYFLSGFPMGESAAEWMDKACLEQEGPEYQALAEIARNNHIYLAGNAYELDANFPQLYFQVSFILDDEGQLILRYRRLISMFAPTPHDVLDRWLELYGEDALFPVVDTPLGRLATVASEEILYPEISRALALRGAEVLCHSSSEDSSPLLTPKNVAKQARAFENHCYVVSANSAGLLDTHFPAASVDGGSRIVNYLGKPSAVAASGESMLANAEIDLAALRAYRRRPAMGNLLARQRLELFAPVYGGESVYPPNTLLDKDGAVRLPDRRHYLDTQAAAITRLQQRGIL